ncbi:MAG: polyprenyl diphosphate synthase [Pseudomonadota bacterium]
MNLPRHIAIVMDGNGRWAQSRRRPRSFGHQAGVKAAREVVRVCAERRVEALTLFAFSSENWNRPANEVSRLMDLFMRSLNREVDELHGNKVRLRFIGDLTAFSPDLRHGMALSERKTEANAGLTLSIAVNYGGRWDVAQAARKLAEQVARGEMAPEEIDERSLQTEFALADLPSPDLLIRTGGEQRISNFLLWQLAYTELYFCETLWPDFGPAQLQLALDDYASRQRRFGRVPTPKQVGNG